MASSMEEFMLYTFKCRNEKCGQETEVNRSMLDDSEVICKCGEKMSKKIYAPQITAHSLPSRKRSYFM